MTTTTPKEIAMTTTTSAWTVTGMTHHQCSACDACASRAIDLARATGSTGGSHADGNHAAAVTRTPTVVR